jgi:hypothetical protein
LPVAGHVVSFFLLWKHVGSDVMRFEFELGRGDYTAERREWLDTADAATWAERIKADVGRRKKSKK